MKRGNAEVTSPIADVLERRADVAFVSGVGAPIAKMRSYELFGEPLCAVVRRDHRLAHAATVTPSELSGEIVWNSLSAPVARHYLAIRDLLEEEGAHVQFRELTFHGSPDALELSFDKGVYVDGASVIAHSLPLITLADEYVAVPVEGCGQLVHRMVCREDDDNPGLDDFVKAVLGIVEHADMSLYWARV